ncbi:MAG: cytochrome c oxidase subunit 3 [Candidatus Nanopelagicales bacterium]
MSSTLSPTTGEPVSVVARRNRVGLTFLIVVDFSGTMALIISYCYLWSLNVNNGWAPNQQTFNGNNGLVSRSPLPWAADWPFWTILLLTVIATAVAWWASRGIAEGHRGRLLTGSLVASLVIIVALVLQIWQMSTFPFGPSNGAYASVVFLLTGSTAVHLVLVAFLLLAVLNRSRAGLISAGNPSQVKLVSMWMTWVCASILLGCLCTTFLKASSNVDPPNFGSFTQFNPNAATPSPSASPSPSQ